MFLKRLTMKGFKSFADTTVLEFEPGVTAVVGPNGAGKSNVVDAVTWVLGAQSTRALRSARMDDVVFMGTAQRAALGRAEVSLTLDNSMGRLPIEGAEVTISRVLFRDADSEYAINGTTCRLLDVQELLGESGVGRQQHMIIGQGQLDSILASNPENRRAVIEEAAGVLNHRRRKERSERRLATTQENLERLGDLVREVRRQMRPLERQAASARGYADVASDLRAARHHLFATRLTNFDDRRRELTQSLDEAGVRERDLRQELAALEARASAAAAEMGSRREEALASTLGTLRGLAARARGTASVIDERANALAHALVASADENVTATLEADAAALDAELAAHEELEASLVPMRESLATSRDSFERFERAFDERWTDSSGTERATLEHARERAALLERAVEDARTLRERLVVRGDVESSRHLSVSGELAARQSDRGAVATELERAEAAAALAGRQLSAADERRRADEKARREGSDLAASARERATTLERALEEMSGSAGREIIGGLDGVLGAVVDLIEVDEGFERAVESAAGASVGATVVRGRRAVGAALAALRREGGAGLILPVAEGDVARPATPVGALALREVVRARGDAPSHVARVLDGLFARAFVATDFEAGLDLAFANADLVIVTREGDCFAPTGWRVTSGRALVTRAALDDARRRADAADAALDALSAALSDSDAALVVAHHDVLVAETSLVEGRAAAASVDADVARLRAAERERDDALSSIATEQSALDERLALLDGELDEVVATFPALNAAAAEGEERDERRVAERRELDERRGRAELEARELAGREAEVAERRRLLETRRHEIEARLVGRGGERAVAAARREGLEFDRAALARLRDVVVAAAQRIADAQHSIEVHYREQLETTRASAEVLEEAREARHGTDARLHDLGEVIRRCEIELAELAVKVANVHEDVRRDLGVEPHEMGPAPLVDVAKGHTLESRVAELEARITSLGPINPLALDELAVLEERYKELDAQVSDVRHARRELQEVLRVLDDEIMSIFSTAFADVNEHFSALIAMLFPGGQGRLLMTEPDDPLHTGVEIEVRPLGRNVRRISLLSGGERSMAALAFLFAVFRSRPSPFYLMDEVEAALDDVNLQRFLRLVDEFREEAQLVIVTHQKRTMEAADALYGVTMSPGASSRVVSQRVDRPREVELA